MTDEKYQEMMAKLHQAGKISGGSGDMPVSNEELTKRIDKAKEVGLIKPVRPLIIEDPMKSKKWEAMSEQKFTGPYADYAKALEQSNKNTEELEKIGVPYEMLQPLVLRKQMEAGTVYQMNRQYQPGPKNYPDLISYKGEGMGLEPEKFTKRPWNPADYIGYSEGNPAVMAKIAEDLKSKAALREEQERLLEPEPKFMSQEDMQLQKKTMMMRSMGMTEDEISQKLNKENAYYNSPEKKALIEELGLKMEFGRPVLDKRDEEALDEAITGNVKKMDDRAQKLYRLMTDEEI